MSGRVILVGAGPGDPGLITVRGAAALREADTVLYDELASPELLSLAPEGAELLNVGKRGHDAPTRSQDEINRMLVDRAQHGHCVVRLKGGDPFVFGRGGEEASACANAGVHFEVVPGVSSAVAALAYAGIPVTDRRHSASFAVVTGHKDPTRVSEQTRWAELATAVDTLVILMGMRNLAQLVDRLVEGGKDPATPSAAVMCGTLAQQQVVVAPLAELPVRVAEAELGSPAAIVVGDVVRLRESLAWWESLPLFGMRVLVTRSAEQAGEMILALRRLGAEPLAIPMIELLPAEDPSTLDASLDRLGSYDAVVFASASAVRFTVARARERGLHALLSGGDLRIVCVGPLTARAALDAGLPVHLMPATRGGAADAEALLAAIEKHLPPAGLRFLLPRSEVGRPRLEEGLSAAGALVDAVVAYRNVRPDLDLQALRAGLRSGATEILTFTSPSTVHHFLGLLDTESRAALSRCIVGAVGPTTADALRREGIEPDVVPDEPSAVALVEAIAGYVRVLRESLGQVRFGRREWGRRAMSYPVTRMRRLRRTATLRRMVRETRLSVDDFVLPFFVVEGSGVRDAIPSMPGVFRHSVDQLVDEAKRVADLGIPAVILFGIPADKDARGSGADAADGVVQRAVAAVKAAVPALCVMTDVCLCEYTDHGHCGIVEGEEVRNDPSVQRLVATALSHAAAGADVVAPSDMMDGRVGAIRAGLDEAGHEDVAILAYAAKFASAYYGPFRDAAESTPQFGDRRAYQMDPPNRREALREMRLDLAEGADALMVKPALPYLDILADARREFDVPLAAYHVSGEYAMIHAAAQRGWIDGDRAMEEALVSIKRAGADWILTYAAADLAQRLA